MATGSVQNKPSAILSSSSISNTCLTDPTNPSALIRGDHLTMKPVGDSVPRVGLLRVHSPWSPGNADSYCCARDKVEMNPEADRLVPRRSVTTPIFPPTITPDFWWNPPQVQRCGCSDRGALFTSVSVGRRTNRSHGMAEFVGEIRSIDHDVRTPSSSINLISFSDLILRYGDQQRPRGRKPSSSYCTACEFSWEHGLFHI